MDQERQLRVCGRCLMAIESREGNQVTKTIYVDEDDIDGSFCEWCCTDGHDKLYELI